jgi:hypothetical protein
VLVLLLTAFVSLLNHANRMLYGDPAPDVQAGEPGSWATVTLLVPIVILIVLGLLLPGPLSTLIRDGAGALLP